MSACWTGCPQDTICEESGLPLLVCAFLWNQVHCLYLKCPILNMFLICVTFVLKTAGTSSFSSFPTFLVQELS